MKLRLYNLNDVPMFQGLAIQAIMQTIGGTLLAAGEVDTTQDAVIYYVKSERGGRVAESVWLDHGDEVLCLAYRTVGDQWQETVRGAGQAAALFAQ